VYSSRFSCLFRGTPIWSLQKKIMAPAKKTIFQSTSASSPYNSVPQGLSRLHQWRHRSKVSGCFVTQKCNYVHHPLVSHHHYPKVSHFFRRSCSSSLFLRPFNACTTFGFSLCCRSFPCNDVDLIIQESSRVSKTAAAN
jgi:hypothetical protein